MLLHSCWEPEAFHSPVPKLFTVVALMQVQTPSTDCLPEMAVRCLEGGWVALLGHNVLLSWQFGDSAGRVTGVMNLMVLL